MGMALLPFDCCELLALALGLRATDVIACDGVGCWEGGLAYAGVVGGGIAYPEWAWC